jgi:hypothetical protein
VVVPTLAEHLKPELPVRTLDPESLDRAGEGSDDRFAAEADLGNLATRIAAARGS